MLSREIVVNYIYIYIYIYIYTEKGGGELLAVVREGEVGGYKERNEEKKIKK